MIHRRTRGLLAAGIAALCMLPAAPAGAGVGPDYVSSDNIELVGRLKTVGDGVGARIVGKYLYVTSTISLSIYDISEAENPVLQGLFTLDVEFENEEVPTNGKILGISGQIGCKDPTGMNIVDPGPTDVDEATGCLSLYDVSNPAAPTFIKSVPGAGQHTQACVLDCQYFYGSTGAIVDARVPAEAKTVGNWQDAIPDEILDGTCHHVREIRPGYLLTSCEPILLLSVLEADGGSPLKPVVIAQWKNVDGRFIHSNQWPNAGQDKFLFAGGETNAQPACDDTSVGAFMTFDTTPVRNSAFTGPVVPGTGDPFFGRGDAVGGPGSKEARLGAGGTPFRKGEFKLIDEVRPDNGTYLDGRTPVNGLGCSVHWFEQHPSFRNGGIVALAEYENGTRLKRIKPDGKIDEVGFFLPLAGSTSAPHWHPNGKVIYAIDYLRGVDVLRYTGPDFVPPPEAAPAVSAAKIAPAKVKAGKTATISYRSSAAGRVNADVSKAGSTVVVKRAAGATKAGANKLRLSTKGLKPGRYTVTLVVSSPDGTPGKPVTLRFQVRK